MWEEENKQKPMYNRCMDKVEQNFNMLAEKFCPMIKFIKWTIFSLKVNLLA